MRHGLLLALATGLFVAAGVVPSAGLARSNSGPVNTLDPQILGSVVVGNTLTATSGVWTPSKPFKLAYRWFQCGKDGGAADGAGCTAVAHGRSAFYQVRAYTAALRLRVRVTAASADGAARAFSDASEPVAAAAKEPVSTSPPSIVGKSVVGGTLTAKAGTMAGRGPITFTYDWRSCGILGGRCVDVSDRGLKSYTLTPRDVGNRLRVRVIARNAAGVTWSASLPTAVVSPAASATAPQNTGEPSISGTPRVGQILRTTNGSWSGTTPLTFDYRWFRCQGRGASDASNCTRISSAADNTYRLREADAGFRIRSQVTASNADGSATATSNPTGVIQSARPANTTEPSISGTAVVGNRLTADRGSWVGDTPITYSFQWLRCSRSGGDCGEIAGATDNSYLLVEADANRTLRVRVTARNDSGSKSAISNPTAVVQPKGQPAPPSGNVVDVKDMRAAGDRLVVSQVRFSPNPVRDPTGVITVRIRVTDQRGRPVRGALVFVRSVPRRTTGGDRQPSASDGWVTYQLQELQHFPRVNGNVQFFVKAYRSGDPVLGGIAGYRLVQVRVLTAG